MFVRIAALLAILQLTGTQDVPNGAENFDETQLKDISQRLDLIKTSSKNLHQEIDVLNSSIDQEIKLQRIELRNVFGGLFALFNIAKQPFQDAESNRQASISQSFVNEQDLNPSTQLNKLSASTTQSTTTSESTTQSTTTSESTTQSTTPVASTTQSTTTTEGTTMSTTTTESTTPSTTPIPSTTQSTTTIASTTQSTTTSESTTQSTTTSESTTPSTTPIPSTTQSTTPIASTTQSTTTRESTTQSTSESTMQSGKITISDVTTTELPLLYIPQPNCAEALQKNNRKNGVLSIKIPSVEPFNAYCLTNNNDDNAIDNRIKADIADAWMVIQRRQDGSVDFNRTWMEYQHGFGNLEGEFFIGLDKLNALTQREIHELWIQIKDFQGEERWAKYSSFKVGAANKKYALDIGRYEGNAGNSLFGHFGAKFSTYDMDNDNNATSHCAQEYGAWWHKNCFDSNLNGPYSNGIIWKHFRGYDMSLKYVHMAIRPAKVV